MAIQEITPPPNSEPELIVAVQETAPPNSESEVVIEYSRNDDDDGDRNNVNTGGI